MCYKVDGVVSIDLRRGFSGERLSICPSRKVAAGCESSDLDEQSKGSLPRRNPRAGR